MGWQKLVENWNKLHKLNKVFFKYSEITLMSAISAKLNGDSLNEHNFQMEGMEDYERCLNLFGRVDDFGAQSCDANIKPIFIYHNGAKTDIRLHLFLLMPSSTGKDSELALFCKLLSAINVAAWSLPDPTEAMLFGTSVRVQEKGKQKIVPQIPYLLAYDCIIENEVETLFKSRRTDPVKVLSIFRRCMDNMYAGSNSVLFNSVRVNALVRPFYGRSVIVCASYPSPKIMEEIKTGTLQRFLVLSVKADMDHVKKVMDVKKGYEPEACEFGSHIEVIKNKVFDEITNEINIKCNALREIHKGIEAKKNVTNWNYYHIKVDENAHKQLLDEMNVMITSIESPTELERRQSFIMRGLAIILKMAAIMTVIDNEDIRAIPIIQHKHLQYCKKLYFEILQDADNNLGLYGGYVKQDVNRYMNDTIKILGRETQDGYISKTIAVNKMAGYWNISYKESKKIFDELEEHGFISFIQGKGNSVNVYLEKQTSNDNVGDTNEVQL